MTELLMIVVLLALNGIFAMAEIALVSSKKARLEQRAKDGVSGAALALRLSGEPQRFLSTVQIGITLVGVLAGAFGGASLAGYLTPILQEVPWLGEKRADEVAFALVVAGITYLSLIIGELVPKNLALRQPETIACVMAGPMDLLSRLAKPAVWVLEISTRGVMRLFGKGPDQVGPTRDEVEVLVREGLITGNMKPEESEMVAGVFDLWELRAEEIMQPKPKVVFLPKELTLSEVAKLVRQTRQAVFPVFEGSRDQVVGLVALRDLFLGLADGQAATVSDLMQEPVFVSDNQPALSLLEELRRSPLGAAMVTDEFGIVRGLVTLDDLVEEVVGEAHGRAEPQAHAVRVMSDGVWLVDGMIEVDALSEAIPGMEPVINAEEESFQTLAGFITHQLERLPREGELFTIGEFEFDVVDMDRQRIDKVTIRRVVKPEAGPEGGEVP
jgi:putative hemolysin